VVSLFDESVLVSLFDESGVVVDVLWWCGRCLRVCGGVVV
jgi:hypothetical protein